MGQSKRASWVEACANVAIGAGVSLVAQLVLFPLYGIHIPLSTDLWLLGWFTVVSLIRSYVLRRVFNKATMKAAHAPN